MCFFGDQAFLSIYSEPRCLTSQSLAECWHKWVIRETPWEHRVDSHTATSSLELLVSASPAHVCSLSNITLPCSPGQGHPERLSALRTARISLSMSLQPVCPICKQECIMGQQLSRPLSNQIRKGLMWVDTTRGPCVSTLLCDHGTHINKVNSLDKPAY